MEKIGVNKIGGLVVWCHEQDKRINKSIGRTDKKIDKYVSKLLFELFIGFHFFSPLLSYLISLENLRFDCNIGPAKGLEIQKQNCGVSNSPKNFIIMLNYT